MTTPDPNAVPPAEPAAAPPNAPAPPPPAPEPPAPEPTPPPAADPNAGNFEKFMAAIGALPEKILDTVREGMGTVGPAVPPANSDPSNPATPPGNPAPPVPGNPAAPTPGDPAPAGKKSFGERWFGL